MTYHDNLEPLLTASHLLARVRHWCMVTQIRHVDIDQESRVRLYHTNNHHSTYQAHNSPSIQNNSLDRYPQPTTTDRPRDRTSSKISATIFNQILSALPSGA
jgi:hypothetical protein